MDRLHKFCDTNLTRGTFIIIVSNITGQFCSAYHYFPRKINTYKSLKLRKGISSKNLDIILSTNLIGIVSFFAADLHHGYFLTLCQRTSM